MHTVDPQSCLPTAVRRMPTSSSRLTQLGSLCLMTTSVRTASMPRLTPFGDGGSQTEPINISLTARATRLFHVCAIGTRSEMLAFQRAALDTINGRVQTFVQRSPRYAGTMCELLRHDASKWTAIRYLAKLWRIEPQEICAVGDDVNDIPMIRHAGLGVAMGHAGAEVLTAADLITGDHEQDGVAMLVDDVLLA